MLSAERRRMPLATQDGKLAQAIDRQAAPVPRRLRWSQAGLAGPTELIEEPVRNSLLRPQNVRSHVTRVPPRGRPDLLTVLYRLAHDLVLGHLGHEYEARRGTAR